MTNTFRQIWISSVGALSIFLMVRIVDADIFKGDPSILHFGRSKSITVEKRGELTSLLIREGETHFRCLEEEPPHSEKSYESFFRGMANIAPTLTDGYGLVTEVSRSKSHRGEGWCDIQAWKNEDSLVIIFMYSDFCFGNKECVGDYGRVPFVFETGDLIQVADEIKKSQTKT